MVVGGAIVLWATVVMLTCAVCIVAARADAVSAMGQDAPDELEFFGTPAPATPELLA